MKKMTKLVLNGIEYTVTDESAVSFAEDQNRTEEEKAQARQNMGAADANALANMTIEGYERTGVFQDIKDLAEKTAGAYAYRKWDGTKTVVASVDIATWNWYRLPVKSGEKYAIDTTIVSSTFAYCLEGENGAVVKYEPTTSPSAQTPYSCQIVIPDGVVFLYVNELASIPCKLQRLNMEIPAFKPIENPNAIDHLYGKKLACVGDSITEATKPDGGYFTNYAELAAARHGMTVYKDGKGGTTMTNVDGKNPFCVSRYLSVPADFDILTIWFGWNDAAYATVGTIDDIEDTTYYGAYKKVLEHFITNYPTKKIGLIVPYGNSSVEPFREAVRNLSEMYGVPCLDLTDGKQCSLLWGTANDAQLARRAALTYDGTHPNQAGHAYLSTMYEAFINRL